MAKVFNGWMESPLFKFIIAPLMVASISGLIVLYGAVKTVETRMSVATIRRDEQFSQIYSKLDKIDTCLDAHMQNWQIHKIK